MLYRKENSSSKSCTSVIHCEVKEQVSCSSVHGSGMTAGALSRPPSAPLGHYRPREKVTPTTECASNVPSFRRNEAPQKPFARNDYALEVIREISSCSPVFPRCHWCNKACDYTEAMTACLLRWILHHHLRQVGSCGRARRILTLEQRNTLAENTQKKPDSF